ncbi:MAG: tetratricopeptide repeat protein [Candidatus Riflebacteria bacterium]|nr:tetratricopeptide repeat protein [Candidatus Riflebacteria bacterium]
MINCPSCGALNNDDSISCVACNSSLRSVCPQCMTHNSPGAAICEKCGRILVEKSDARIIQKRLDDPIEEMYKMTSNKKENKKTYKTSFIKVFVGAFVFAIINITPILRGHFIWQFILSLTSGVFTLWGLVEITFLLIDEGEIVKNQPTTYSENSFPEKPPVKNTALSESFEQIETEHRSTILSGAGSYEKNDAAIAPIGNKEDRFVPPPEPKHFESLADFLATGIEEEMTAVNNKLKQTPNNYALLMRLSQLHEEKGEFDKAIEKLDKCIKIAPETAEIFLYHGTLLRRIGNLDAARKSLNKSAELNAFVSKTYYQLGVLELTQQNYAEAKNMFQKSIQLSPDDPYAHYQLGITYNNLGDNKLAIMEIKRATILHPTDSYGHSKLGQLYQQTHQLDKAISAYSQALSIKGADSFVIERLAEVLAEKGDFERAATLFQEALSGQFHPEIKTMLSLGKTLRNLNRFEELETITNEILRLAPNEIEASFLNAVSLIKQNKNEKAKIILERITENPSVTYEAWIELGKIYQSEGNAEKSVTAYIKATTNAPDQAGIWNNIGILLSNQKAYEEAVKAFRKALSFDYTDSNIVTNLKTVQTKLEANCKRIIEARQSTLARAPEDIEAYLDMGKAYEILEMPDEALNCYKKLLGKKPTHIRGLMSYAELLRKTGQLKMAIRCYREIIKIDPENASTHLFLVQANLNLGFINDALYHANIAESLTPDDAKVHFLLGKIYLAKGLAPRALKEFSHVSTSVSDPDMIAWAELMRRRLSRTNN